MQNQLELCGDQGGVLQIIIDSLDCGDVDNVGGGNLVSVHAFMTANINGEQYNDMKPNGYLFFPEGVAVNDFFTRTDDDYIVMHGNSGYANPSTIAETDREINLKIPSIKLERRNFCSL